VGKPQVSAALEARVLEYIKGEESFTFTFAAWDMSQTGKLISPSAVGVAIRQLIERGELHLKTVEDAGHYGKVYAYSPPGRLVESRLPELDAHRHAILADLAPERGAPVAHTGRPHADGPTKSLKQRRRAAAALKRAS
jgi:hypothetical protein